MMRYNLLAESLIQTDRGWYTLPGLMAAMAQEEVATFPALRPHQRPAWHMFLVQLGVLALDAAGLQDLPKEEAAWCNALRCLTPDYSDDAPWHLVVDEAVKPAFLQSPDPGDLKRSEVSTPDALDMLITSRNHDLKREIARKADPQDWLFALVSVQTMEGYSGVGNYGIARMNRGSSSRAMLTLAPSVDGSSRINPAAWWRRDTRILLDYRSKANDEKVNGDALLWLKPWPQGCEIDLATLDPLFIEICRRIRLREGDEGLKAICATSRGPRINAKEAKGSTNDPWAPIHITDAKALTLGEGNWTYKKLAELLYSDPTKWKIPMLAKPTSAEKAEPVLIVAEAIGRGNSKTYGFHSRVVSAPKAVTKDMLGERAANLAETQIKDIKNVDLALRCGLALVAANGDREKLDNDKKKHYAHTRPASSALDRFADTVFFPALWKKLKAKSDQEMSHARNDFVHTLAQKACQEFNRALPAIPCAKIMRSRAEVRGRAQLERSLDKVFKDIGAQEENHA